MKKRTAGMIQLDAKSGNIRFSLNAAECPVDIMAPVWTNGTAHRAGFQKLRSTARGWTSAGQIEFDSGKWTIEDTYALSGNTLVIDRTWKWRGELLPSVRLGLDLFVPFKKLDFWTIPYISMNGNAGANTAPAGMSLNGTPWVFREERTTAPGLMTLEYDGTVAGSYTEPGRTPRDISACSMIPERKGHTLRTFFPYREGPCTFLGTGHPGNSNAHQTGIHVSGDTYASGGMVVEDGATFCRRFYVVLDKADEARHGYFKIWESAWRNLKDPIAAPVTVKKAEKALWNSLDHFWVSKGDVHGYSLRISRDGNPLESFSPCLSAAWCAPTFMQAWLAIRRAIREGSSRQTDRALQAAAFFISAAPLGNGLFLTHFDLKFNRWSTGSLNAVQMGGAAYWILRCVELLRSAPRLARKVETDRWLAFALDFCDLAVRTQKPSGSFCAHWTKDGRCTGSERAMGVHSARAVLQAYRHTGKRKYLEAAERGAGFYIKNIVDRESGYGDCTDLLNSTTENDAAGVPDLLLELHDETHNALYLAKAIRAAEYSLSFMLTYNVHFPPETECARRKMRTRGSSAISPETAFISFFFAPQANTFLELWKRTGQNRWKEYAVAVVRGTLQMMSEPGDTFGLAPQLTGCRGEVLALLDTVKGAHVWKQGMTGYTWHQPVWWPATFNLLNFAVIEDQFPGVLGNIEK